MVEVRWTDKLPENFTPKNLQYILIIYTFVKKYDNENSITETGRQNI